MGYSEYSFSSRSARSKSFGYSTKSADDIFTQNKQKRAHKDMLPANVKIREARDSDLHPLTIPIIFALDVTGSMGHIPHELVKHGLPTMMSKIMQNGVKDPALLFLAVGDTYSDNAPLQVGQFESGDAELDMWLVSTYIEKGGGGNDGESYSLAWYFAANHTVTDAWEKRGKKGILITIGDEKCLPTLPKSSIDLLMENASAAQGDYTSDMLLTAAQQKWEVFHLHATQGSNGQRALPQWKELLGENCIEVTDYTEVPNIVADIIVGVAKSQGLVQTPVNENETPSSYDTPSENSSSDSTDSSEHEDML